MLEKANIDTIMRIVLFVEKRYSNTSYWENYARFLPVKTIAVKHFKEFVNWEAFKYKRKEVILNDRPK